MSQFENQVVVVTGAAGNLGAAVANAFAAQGAHIVAIDRSTETMEKLFPTLAGTPNHLLVEGINLMDDEAIQRVAKNIDARFGRVDVLVNTVGGYRAGTPVHETPLASWHFMLELNAGTVYSACHAILPIMLKNGHGHIINTSAKAGLAGSANHSAYSASKSAVMRLTESLAAEYKDRGITVNTVMPATIDTPQNRAAMPNADFSKWTTPEQIAAVITFLASDAGSIITGAHIPV